MTTLKYSWKKAIDKENKYFYLIHLNAEEVYKSELFNTQQEAQDHAADNLSFYWPGTLARVVAAQDKGSITFTFKEESCPKGIVN